MTTNPFGRVSFYQDNPGSPQPPTGTDDSSLGFGPGSRWLDTRFGVWWICQDATPGLARWAPQTSGQVLASLVGANMNVTTDQLFKPNFNLTILKWSPSKIIVTNASESMTTAAGGIYSAAAKGGVAIVAAAQAYSGLTTAASLLALTIATAGGNQVFSTVPVFSLTTPQGSTGTADIYVIGDIIPNG